jgi:NhaP-type Na+/H+ or K+/H+ antiporter
MEEKSSHQKSLFKVIALGSALSFGAVGAIIASMKDFLHGDAAFSLSYRTLIGLLVGCVVGWVPWRFMAKKAGATEAADDGRPGPQG